MMTKDKLLKEADKEIELVDAQNKSPNNREPIATFNSWTARSSISYISENLITSKPILKRRYANSAPCDELDKFEMKLPQIWHRRGDSTQNKVIDNFNNLQGNKYTYTLELRDEYETKLSNWRKFSNISKLAPRNESRLYRKCFSLPNLFFKENLRFHKSMSNRVSSIMYPPLLQKSWYISKLNSAPVVCKKNIEVKNNIIKYNNPNPKKNNNQLFCLLDRNMLIENMHCESKDNIQFSDIDYSTPKQENINNSEVSHNEGLNIFSFEIDSQKFKPEKFWNLRDKLTSSSEYQMTTLKISEDILHKASSNLRHFSTICNTPITTNEQIIFMKQQILPKINDSVKPQKPNEHLARTRLECVERGKGDTRSSSGDNNDSVEKEENINSIKHCSTFLDISNQAKIDKVDYKQTEIRDIENKKLQKSEHDQIDASNKIENKYEDEKYTKLILDKFEEKLVPKIKLYLPLTCSLIACCTPDASRIVGFDDNNIGIELNLKLRCEGKLKIYYKLLDGRLKESRKSMYEAIAYLYELERDLQTQLDLTSSIPLVESIDRLISQLNVIKSTEDFNAAYVKESFTDGILRQLYSLTTKFCGTLRHCIRSNAYCPRSLTPKACDPDAYTTFASMFNPILRKINKCHTLRHHPVPFYGAPAKMRMNCGLPVRSFRIRFSRNIRDFPFYLLATKIQFKEVENICKTALLAWPGERRGYYYSIEDLKIKHAKLYQYLQKKGIFPNIDIPARQASGVQRHWPEGRGIYLAHNTTKNCLLLAQINMEDHLRVISIDWSGRHLDHAYNLAVKLMQWLDKNLSFSYKKNYGFLSPVPFNVGTGMRVSALLQLKYLSSSEMLLTKVCSELGLSLRPGDGIGRSVNNFVYDVSQSAGIGTTEISTVLHFPHQLHRLIKEEANLLIKKSKLNALFLMHTKIK